MKDSDACKKLADALPDLSLHNIKQVLRSLKENTKEYKPHVKGILRHLHKLVTTLKHLLANIDIPKKLTQRDIQIVALILSAALVCKLTHQSISILMWSLMWSH